MQQTIIQEARSIDFVGLQVYEKKAKKGFQYYQYALGLIYEHGLGSVQTNLSQAIHWYQLASFNDHRDAQIALNSQNRLTEIISNATDCDYSRLPPKYKNMIFHFVGNNNNLLRVSIHISIIALILPHFINLFPENHLSQFLIGLCYQHGIGCSQSEEKAIEWYCKPSFDNIIAKTLLADIYVQKKEYVDALITYQQIRQKHTGYDKTSFVIKLINPIELATTLLNERRSNIYRRLKSLSYLISDIAKLISEYCV